MKLLFLIAFLGFSLGVNIGCSHFHKVEGPEPKSEIPEGVRVSIGSSEVKEGDVVDIFKRKCIKRKMRVHAQGSEACTTTKLGQTVVTKVLTKDVAIVRAPADFTLETDMYVEKGK